MPCQIRSRLTRGRFIVAQRVYRFFWRRSALPYLRAIRLPPEEFVVDWADCYAALRLAALRAAVRCPTTPDLTSYKRYIWKALRWAFKAEMRRSCWWLDDEAMQRLRAYQDAGASPTVDLLVPRSFSEVVEPDPHFLTHLIDDLPPDRATSPDPTFAAVLARVQAQELYALFDRMPARYRKPVWLVHAEGVDVYTAGKALGLHVSVCHERATAGLAWLKAAVARNPECLMSPDEFPRDSVL